MFYLNYFVIFSIMGWMLEAVFRSVKNRRMINPGLLKGFYLPIYGFGALFVLGGHVILDTYSLPIRSLFYLICLSVLELITGAAIEKIFHVRLWDYRDDRFNIRGHVCLLFSIYWMLLATGLDIALDFLIPWALHVYERFDLLIDVVLGSIGLAMLIDFIVVVRRWIRERSGPVDQDTARARWKFIEIARPLLEHPGVIKLNDINHHLGKSRLDHVLDVSWKAFRISQCLSLDSEAVVKGALLHDFFYYDWLREGPRWHGIRHPLIALQNARRITPLSAKEEDIIKKHMWPLTVRPPRYPESWVVCFTDIYCSWRDYLAPMVLFCVGRRKEWLPNETSRFPSYRVINNGFLLNVEKASSRPGPKLAGRSLNILLIDAQPRALPFTKFRTLTLPRVAGATPGKHNVRIIDGRVEKIEIPSGMFDLVGITFSTNNAPMAYEIVKKAKKTGLLTVAGGTHATAVPEEVLEHFDAVLIGEAEGGAWESLLKDAELGSLKKIYRNAEPPDLRNLAPPRLDLLHGLYLPVYPVEATRGCPNRCSYCFNRYIHPTYRKRPIDEVAADVARADSRHIFFMDDNLCADRKYAKELFAALVPLKKKLWMQMELRSAQDEELVRLAAEAGCKGVFVGLESINTASLKSVDKSFNHAEKYKEQISALTRHGILVGGGLIFGLNGDGPEVFTQTLEFFNTSDITSLAPNLVIPYPGTAFHGQITNEGRLLNRDYKCYTGYSVIVQPERMTADQLEKEYDKFNQEFFSIKNLFSRFRHQNLPLRVLPYYVVFNMAYRVPRKAKSRTHWAELG